MTTGKDDSLLSMSVRLNGKKAERPCSRRQGCLMERDEADDMLRRYTVRAQLKVMILMGQDIWVDVEHFPLYGLLKSLTYKLLARKEAFPLHW
ncbi:hypothetical protein NC652_007966 [Populus alba x Populus x berolinensis]|nr:hypothetical protein NC652_007966 [Populus alba x Populus x berolinensis]